MAQGSGVYYNVGRTAVFRDHWDALASLPGGHNDRNANAEATPLQQIARLAQAAGLDSVQYTHRLEFLYLHELQDVRDDLGSREQICPGPKMALAVRGGWQGRDPCVCTGKRYSIMDCTLQWRGNLSFL